MLLTWSNCHLCIDDLEIVGEAIYLHCSESSICHGLENLLDQTDKHSQRTPFPFLLIDGELSMHFDRLGNDAWGSASQELSFSPPQHGSSQHQLWQPSWKAVLFQCQSPELWLSPCLHSAHRSINILVVLLILWDRQIVVYVQGKKQDSFHNSQKCAPCIVQAVLDDAFPARPHTHPIVIVQHISFTGPGDHGYHTFKWTPPNSTIASNMTWSDW